jgi:hypothetical protein
MAMRRAGERRDQKIKCRKIQKRAVILQVGVANSRSEPSQVNS